MENIKYPFKAKDEQGQVYVFNKTDGKVEITLPDGVRQLAEGQGVYEEDGGRTAKGHPLLRPSDWKTELRIRQDSGPYLDDMK